jgi:hypothetical protein
MNWSIDIAVIPSWRRGFALPRRISPSALQYMYRKSPPKPMPRFHGGNVWNLVRKVHCSGAEFENVVPFEGAIGEQCRAYAVKRP